VEKKQHKKKSSREKTEAIKDVLAAWNENRTTIIGAVANVCQRNSKPGIKPVIEGMVVLVMIVVMIHSWNNLRVKYMPKFTQMPFSNERRLVSFFLKNFCKGQLAPRKAIRGRIPNIHPNTRGICSDAISYWKTARQKCCPKILT
jgi:hypothetical protein